MMFNFFRNLRYNTRYFARNVLYGVNEFCLWDSLKKIGSNRVARLTVLVPILGTFLIYSDELIKYIIIYKQIANEAGRQAEEFTLSSLHFSYFGLSFIAIASFLFAMFCPKEIQESGGESDYVSSSTNNTSTVAKSNFMTIESTVGSYYPNSPKDYFLDAKFRYPDELDRKYSELIEEMLSDSEYDKFIKDTLQDEEGGGIEADDNLFDEHGEFKFPMDGSFPQSSHPHMISHADVMKIRMAFLDKHDRWWFEPFVDVARRFPQEVAFVHYGIRNHIRPAIRWTIAFLYLIGFSLALIPAIRTALLIIVGIAKKSQLVPIV